MSSARRSQSGIPLVKCQATKVVFCEQCKCHYAYQLMGSASNGLLLQNLLSSTIEAIPCPACGWYQSTMIARARSQHLRGMGYLGLCLTVWLIPVAAFIGPIAGFHRLFFVVPVVSLFAVGISLLIWRRRLAQNYNPNEEEVKGRKKYGQARSSLLSSLEANEFHTYGGSSYGRIPVTQCSCPWSRKDMAALVFCFFLACAFLTGGGFLAAYWIDRAQMPARFEKEIPAYIALIPATRQNGVDQPRPSQPASASSKAKGKMVVINVDEAKIDALQFSLPGELCAWKPVEVGTVVLLAWEKKSTSSDPLFGPALYPNRFMYIAHVKVFDWESKSEIASSTFFGDLPGFLKGESATGPKPDQQVLNFLKALPRE
jgi:hypothetical protein